MADLRQEEIFKNWVTEVHGARRAEILDELEATKDQHDTMMLVAELRGLRRIREMVRGLWDRKNHPTLGVVSDSRANTK